MRRRSRHGCRWCRCRRGSCQRPRRRERRRSRARSGRRRRHIRGPTRLELTRDERRSLVNHPGVDVLVVRGEAPTVWIANEVVVYTQVDGLRQILLPDCDRRVIDRMHEAWRRFSEEGHRCDVVGHVGRHRRRHIRGRNAIRHRVRRDETRHRRPLGESAEHHLGVRTARRGGKDMAARVRNSLDGGGEVGSGRVVDRIHPERLRADSRTQRVHERLSRRANTRQLGGAAGEYHLGVGAGFRACGRYGCDLHRRRRRCRSTDQSSDVASPHRPMLTHRDTGRTLNASPRRVVVCRRRRPKEIAAGARNSASVAR